MDRRRQRWRQQRLVTGWILTCLAIDRAETRRPYYVVDSWASSGKYIKWETTGDSSHPCAQETSKERILHLVPRYSSQGGEGRGTRMWDGGKRKRVEILARCSTGILREYTEGNGTLSGDSITVIEPRGHERRGNAIACTCEERKHFPPRGHII